MNARALTLLLLPLWLASAVAAPTALFDGQTFAGWEGETNSVWRVREGVIVGGSLNGNPRNEFLATRASYKNFRLRLEYKLVGTEGFVNGGVQFRSRRIANPPNEMSGFQADIGAGYSGCLYDESRRNRMLVMADTNLVARVEKPGDWNTYEIVARGPEIQLSLNGQRTASWVERDPNIAAEGVIALQIHGNCKAEISFRNITIEELPSPTVPTQSEVLERFGDGQPGAPLAAFASFVTKTGATLQLNGKEYRAIGVNIPHLHQAYFGTWLHIPEIYGTPEKARQAMLDALDDAQRSRVAFIRFFAAPGYPRDIEMLYAHKPEEYWKQMDDLFAQCRRRGLRLIPSLQTLRGWYLYCGENAQAILDPSSKTHRATHQYIREFVTRYKDDPTVLLWELENEAMLAADVDMAGRELPSQGVYPPGVTARTRGVREDSLTWEMTLRLYREHTAFIKSLDPNHLVTSGDASVRPECSSRRETFPHFKYRNDTLREWLANNLASQPKPLEVFSVHFYGSPDAAEPWSFWNLSADELLRSQVRSVHAARIPLFIGELGQMKPDFKADREGRWTSAAIDLLEQEGVALAALWVWHFPWQPELTVDSTTHPKLVKRIAEFNRKHAGMK